MIVPTLVTTEFGGNSARRRARLRTGLLDGPNARPSPHQSEYLTVSLNLVSVSFFGFFAIVFALYWLSPNNNVQKGVLVLASYVFYASFDYRFCLLLLLASVSSWVLGRMMRRPMPVASRKMLLTLGVGGNLLVLGVFKYLDFFAASATRVLALLGFRADSFTLSLALPIGISFFLFKIVSYLVDVFRAESGPYASLLDFSLYVAFFPQLLAGPIDRFGTFLPQLEARRSFDYSLAVAGTQQVLWGLFKKLALADGIAVIVDYAYGSHLTLSGPQLAAAASLYSFQIYCDFSGYTDISVGVSKLLGFKPMRNFAYPYFSQNVAEFWRRWNISVSTWFRDYVYIPLGGSRVSRPRLAANILVTFLLSGLWHGAGLNFLVWGALLGAGVIVTSFRGAHVLKMEDTPGGERMTPRVAGRMLLTFVYITLAWVFFRSESTSQALEILGRIGTSSLSPGAWLGVKDLVAMAPVTVTVLILFVVVEWVRRRDECPLWLPHPSRTVRWAAYTLVIWLTLLIMQPQLTGRFIYFDF